MQEAAGHVIVRVVHVPVAALVRGRGKRPEAARPVRGRSLLPHGVVTAGGQPGLHVVAPGLSGHDVDGPAEGVHPQHPRRRTLQHLDALHVGQIDRHVEVVMPRLRVGHVDPVEQHQHLVGRAAPDGEVGLHAARAPLAHVQPGHLVEQLVHRAHGKAFYLLPVQHREHPPQLGIHLTRGALTSTSCKSISRSCPRRHTGSTPHAIARASPNNSFSIKIHT